LVLLITLYESCTYVSRNMAFLCFCVCVTKIIRCHLVCICTRACLDQKCAEGTNSSSSDLVQNFHPCLGRQKSTTWLSLLNAQLLSISTLCDVFMTASLSALCSRAPRIQLLIV